MTRAFALLVAVVVLAGCKGSGSVPPIDPFGRTTVEPPPTGAASLQPPGPPVNPGTAQGGASAARTAPAVSPGPTPATPASVPASAPGYAPPGGHFEFNGSPTDEPRPTASTQPGDRISIPVDARDLSKQPTVLAGGPPSDIWASAGGDKSTRGENPAAAVAGDSSGRSSIALAGSAPQGVLSGRESIVRTIPPRPSDSVDAAAGASPAAESGVPQGKPGELPQNDEVINIMDLPAAGASRQQRTTPGSEGVRLVSATVPVETSSQSPATSIPPADPGNAFSAKTRYDHAPDYGWLRGRLEHSQIDQRWKLRYIPVYGEMDDFGGSVLIADDSALSGYERGDFVEIHGQLDTSGRDDRHFTPEYKVRQIDRLAD